VDATIRPGRAVVKAMYSLVVGYFESVGFDSLNPVMRSQIMKAHQIARARSRRTAAVLTGFTNKNKGVKIRRIIPQTTFGLKLR